MFKGYRQSPHMKQKAKTPESQPKYQELTQRNFLGPRNTNRPLLTSPPKTLHFLSNNHLEIHIKNTKTTLNNLNVL
jgi:hypothetical protein